MRCPSCEADNDEGAAICAQCAAPLTAYAGGITGQTDPRTVARARELLVRPRVGPIVAGADVALALLVLAGVAKAVLTRPQLNEDSTNYMGHAIGGVSAVFHAATMLPVAACLLALGWGAMSQRSWAWYGNAALMLFVGVAGLVGVHALPVPPLLQVGIAACGMYFWMQRSARRWYGAA